MKAKAPVWLRESFRDGVDEHEWPSGLPLRLDMSPGCWLASLDPEERPCSGRLERFHFIGRQRVEHALGALLPPGWEVYRAHGAWPDQGALILLAAWDSRNGGIACEHHHRRFGSHATPELAVPLDALPSHVHEFIEDWDLQLEAERRFS